MAVAEMPPLVPDAGVDTGLHDRIERVTNAHAAHLVSRTHSAPLVFVSAPTGFGKTHLAHRLAGIAGHCVAWCSVRPKSSASTLLVDVCRALLTAWPDAPNEPGDVSEANARQLLRRSLDVIGATSLVLDDVDHLIDDGLDEALREVSSAGSLRILMTSQTGPTPALTLHEAGGRLVRVVADDLSFSVEQCTQMLGDDDAGRELHAATGGWPVAVLVAARARRNRSVTARDDSLLRLFLQAYPMFDRRRLAVAALLDGLPPTLVEWLHPATLRRSDPTAATLLLQSSTDGTSIRRWAREALRVDPLDPDIVDRALDLLGQAGEHEVRLTLAIGAGRIATVTQDIERHCAIEVATGGHHRVRRLVDRIAPEHRTVDIDVSAVLAEQATASRRPHEDELRDLVRRARGADGRAAPRANAALANHLRMIGDPSVIEVCHEVVAPLVDLDPDAAAAAARSLWPDLADRSAAAELLRFLGHGAMLSRGAGMFAAGRRMVECALRIMEDEQSVRSQQGWLLYLEALMFVEKPSHVVLRARTIALELWRARHSDAPLRLSELAILEFFSGFHQRSRSTIELAREASAETGNDLAAIPLASLECALDVLEQPTNSAFVDAFEQAIFGLLDHDYLAVFHKVFAAEFGLLQMRLGNIDVAAHFAAVAEGSPDTFMAASFSLRRRRLNALLLAEQDQERGRIELLELRTVAVRLGRSVLVELIDGDLAGVAIDHTATVETSAVDDRLRIIALAPALSIWRGDCELPPPTGYTARLLALLIASSGVVTIDVALEALWPDADPRVSRNRLHGVLLRLRRALGFGPDGPVACRDELIRLEAGPTLWCDAWELEADLDAGTWHGGTPSDIADLLSEQFRYDDRVSEYRERLRRRLDHSLGSA